MWKLLFLSISLVFVTACNKSPNIITAQAYGCEDKVEWNICNGKPTYLGEIQLIISKEGGSVKMSQRPANGVSFFTAGTFIKANCVITDSNNWSCKEKSPYGELYFVNEMIDGLFLSSHASEYIKGSGLSFVGYQGIKGLLIKYDLWHPTDYFKAGKKES